MTEPNVEVVANDVGHLMARVERMEAKVEAIMKTQYWLMGGGVVFGAFMTLLLPSISAALGLP